MEIPLKHIETNSLSVQHGAKAHPHALHRGTCLAPRPQLRCAPRYAPRAPPGWPARCPQPCRMALLSRIQLLSERFRLLFPALRKMPGYKVKSHSGAVCQGLNALPTSAVCTCSSLSTQYNIMLNSYKYSELRTCFLPSWPTYGHCIKSLGTSSTYPTPLHTACSIHLSLALS